MAAAEARLRVDASDRGKRLDRWLRERIPGWSRTRIQAAIATRVRVSWLEACRPSTLVVPGGTVHLEFEPLRESPEDLPELRVVARGPGWFAIDKPAGIPVHPVRSARLRTVTGILSHRDPSSPLHPAHRLDRETSGVLLFATDPATAKAFGKAFAHGRVRKEYLAVVRGPMRAARGTVDLPIGRASESAVVVRLRAGVADGVPATTHWRVERRFPTATLVRLHPETGRRHQIRVHLESLGHPVLGDPLYGRPDADYLALVRGDPDPRRARGEPPRQLLHCASLQLDSPAGLVRVEVPPPEDFEWWCAELARRETEP